MGIFIEIEIDHEKCLGPEKSGECARVCPVNIFAVQDGKVAVVKQNEDECILCNLCLDKCQAAAIAIRKLYK
jgi:NAD-dependent dihydropyrimidine dehydrogenase PreA subunit